MNINSIFRSALVLMISALPFAASATDFDGSEALTCAAIHAAECVAEEQKCTSGTPWMVNFPVFMEMDFKAKKLSTNDLHQTPRVSSINNVSSLQTGHTIVQGIDEAYAWSMIIAEDTGSFTLSISGEETGFIIFGACHSD